MNEYPNTLFETAEQRAERDKYEAERKAFFESIPKRAEQTLIVGLPDERLVEELRKQLSELGVLRTLDQQRIAALEAELARVTKERDALLAAACTAYGHLWHVNNEPMAPIPIYTPEKAAYAARKVLRDLLTSEQRGDAINATQNVWGDAARKEGK